MKTLTIAEVTISAVVAISSKEVVSIIIIINEVVDDSIIVEVDSCKIEAALMAIICKP